MRQNNRGPASTCEIMLDAYYDVIEGGMTAEIVGGGTMCQRPEGLCPDKASRTAPCRPTVSRALWPTSPWAREVPSPLKHRGHSFRGHVEGHRASMRSRSFLNELLLVHGSMLEAHYGSPVDAGGTPPSCTSAPSGETRETCAHPCSSTTVLPTPRT